MKYQKSNYWVEEGLENGKEVERLFQEIIRKNFPNLETYTSIHIQEGQTSQVRFTSTKYNLKHVIKLSRLKTMRRFSKQQKKKDNT
jgi:hypothetical protein